MEREHYPEHLPARMAVGYVARFIVPVAKTTWYGWDQAGRTPEPIDMLGGKHWLRADLDLWGRLHCPCRERFKAMKDADAGRNHNRKSRIVVDKPP